MTPPGAIAVDGRCNQRVMSAEFTDQCARASDNRSATAVLYS